MIYLTGDCHGDFSRFEPDTFSEQKYMTKDDYVIICGDFGGIWNIKENTEKEMKLLNWLDSRPFTTLFVCGNHENFDRLYRYPVEKWNGGNVHYIRKSILHLMRGQVFTIDGLKFFTFGGATSHDVQGGILEPEDPEFIAKYEKLKKGLLPFRINRISWWKQEQPSKAEMNEGLFNLSLHHNKVDYIITHGCAASTLALFSGGRFRPDDLSHYLEKIKQTCRYKSWFFGHYHRDIRINDKEQLLYQQIVRIR